MDKMATLILGKGYFQVWDQKGKTTVWLRDFQSPCARYGMEFEKYFKQLPDINDAYEVYQGLGYSAEGIIDELLKLYFPLRLFRVGDYENLPLCIGFIGTRGSGKTAGAVQTVCIDYLLRGLTAYSNINIAVRVVYKDAEKVFRSEPLDKMNMLDLSEGYENGVVLLDEVNMEAGEAQRASSGANLQLGYAVQQIRKRNLSLIWTCQGWNWVDNRLRWQLDFAIDCQDAYLAKGSMGSYLGERSVWTCHDISGLSGTFDSEFTQKQRYMSAFKIWKGEAYVRPWWFAYDTYELKGQDDYISDYRKNKSIGASRTYALPEGKSSSEVEFANKMAESGITNISCSIVWESAGVENDKPGQTRLGKALKAAGYQKRRNGSGYYYELKDRGNGQ